MGYNINGILCNRDTAENMKTVYRQGKFIRLRDDIILVPMTEELFDEINENKSSIPIGKFVLLNENVHTILKNLSDKGKIAYIEADYFGGIGYQSAIVWDNGVEIYHSEINHGVINEALSILGIIPKDRPDEFDTIGLGRKRSTCEWLEDEINSNE